MRREGEREQEKEKEESEQEKKVDEEEEEKKGKEGRELLMDECSKREKKKITRRKERK